MRERGRKEKARQTCNNEKGAKCNIKHDIKYLSIYLVSEWIFEHNEK